MEKLHRISDALKPLQLSKAFALLTEEYHVLGLKLESYSKSAFGIKGDC